MPYCCMHEWCLVGQDIGVVCLDGHLLVLIKGLYFLIMYLEKNGTTCTSNDVSLPKKELKD